MPGFLFFSPGQQSPLRNTKVWIRHYPLCPHYINIRFIATTGEGPGSPVPPILSPQACGSDFPLPPPCSWACSWGKKILQPSLICSFLLSGRCSPHGRVALWQPRGSCQNTVPFLRPWQIAVFIYSEVLCSTLFCGGFEIIKWSSSSQLKLLRSGKGAAQETRIPLKQDNKPLKYFSFAQPSDLCAICGPWG